MPHRRAWIECRSAIPLLNSYRTAMKAFAKFKKIKRAGIFFLLALAGGHLWAGELPANGQQSMGGFVDFDRDIRPIFEASCFRCHSAQKPRSHFRLDYRAGALAGGEDNTNDIVPGDSQGSRLIDYVSREVPDKEMPPEGRGESLTAQQIELLRVWIDQGASWGTNNGAPQFAMSFEPALREFSVSGNRQKFRELEGVREGASGGIDHFSVIEQINPTDKLSLEGRAIVPSQDFALKLALQRDDVGFVHVGMEQWRKYYATDGGFNPTVNPAAFNIERDLHVDQGRAWADFGLTLPRWPEIILGYEYRYRVGTESTLDWGYANGKNIYPATQSVNERTHIAKLTVTKSFGDWQLENYARVELYGEKNSGAESAIILGGQVPDETINTRDRYQHVLGTDTLTIERQIRDWWFLNGGFYYSRLSGNDFFHQATVIPAFHFNHVLSSQEVTLSRESEIFSLANLFSPLNCLTFSLGTQSEWTRERGFGESIPNFDLAGTVPLNSGLDEFKASQTANFRFTKIPFSVIFGDARFSEDYYTVTQGGEVQTFKRETAAENLRRNLKTGFTTSPWRWMDLTAQVENSGSDTDYRQLKDLFNGAIAPTNGYPGFILNRRIHGDTFETKLVLRPVTWFNTTLSYQLASTDYSSKTDPAFDPVLARIVSNGGYISDGHYDSQTYGISATLTPRRRFYLTTAFTYSHSRATTAANHDPSVAPYQGNIFTVYSAATIALNEKTGLQLAYTFSHADYAQANFSDGVPAGLNYSRNAVIAGLTRAFSRRLEGAVRYEFSQYQEPGHGNGNDFTAHGIFATVNYRWP